MTIKRIGPVSCARIAGVIYAALGLLIGACVSLFTLIGAAFSSTQLGSAHSPLIGAAIGIGAVVFFPILYGAMGFFFALNWGMAVQSCRVQSGWSRDRHLLATPIHKAVPKCLLTRSFDVGFHPTESKRGLSSTCSK